MEKKILRQPWSAIKQKGEIRRTVKNQELLGAAVVQIRRMYVGTYVCTKKFFFFAFEQCKVFSKF